MRMIRAAAAVLLAVTMAAPALGAPEPTRTSSPKMPRGSGLLTAHDGLAVVALIDTGINPYSPAFRDRSKIAYRHPSTYIEGYAKDAEALRLSLDLPYEEAVEKDAAIWQRVVRNKLYWIPGTRIVGGISFGAGGTNCPTIPIPPVNGLTQGDCDEHVLLDDHGHGTMTASRAAGAPASLAPRARIVEIEGLGARSVQWAADQGWIDVQSNSWLSLVPPPVPSDTTDAFADAATKTFTIAASGNGAAYIAGVAPTPTYALSTAPPGVILVGGHDNGKMTLWSGSPPHVVADAYAGVTAIAMSDEQMRSDPIACCSSAAAPYAAGGATALVMEARRILGDDTSGIHNGIVAEGRCGAVKKGPLADGDLTLEEMRQLFFRTAEARPSEGADDGMVHWAGEPRAPDNTEYGPGANPFCIGCTTTPIPWSSVPAGADAYPLIGYGAINERSLDQAIRVLRGGLEEPARAGEDAHYEQDQALRGAIFGNALTPSVGEETVSACIVLSEKQRP